MLKYPCFSSVHFVIVCIILIDCTAPIDGIVLHDCSELSIDYFVPVIVRPIWIVPLLSIARDPGFKTESL
jgi:hypothetical protein